MARVQQVEEGIVNLEKFRLWFLGVMLLVALVSFPFVMYWAANVNRAEDAPPNPMSVVLVSTAPSLIMFGFLVALFVLFLRKALHQRRDARLRQSSK